MIDFSLPTALAERLHAEAERRETDADTLLQSMLKLLLDCCETGWRRDQWLMSMVKTDDGPTPPTGLERVIADYPRWQARAALADVDDAAETAGADPSTDPSSDPPGDEPAGHSSLPCILLRDDAVAVHITFVPATREVAVQAMTRDRQDQLVLELERHEVWVDFGSRAWRRVLDAADHLANELTQADPDGNPPADEA